MLIDEDLISYMEELSYLTLSPEEKIKMREELQKLFTGISKLSGLNTEGIKETYSTLEALITLRDDRELLSFDRELILKNAPRRNDELFIAPKTLD